MDRNERIHKDVLEARVDAEVFLIDLDQRIEKLRRRKQITAYLWAALFFIIFSALAFYMGAWFATSRGLCIG